MAALKFRYKALEQNTGSIVQGELTSIDENSALQELNNNGLIPIDLIKADHGWLKSILATEIGAPKNISLGELGKFSEQISSLLGSGLSLEKSLEVSKSLDSSKNIEKLTNNILEELRKGKSLTEAIEEQSEKFPSLFIDIIRSGEESGSLNGAFKRLALYFNKKNEFRSRIKASLTYPFILIVASIISIFFLIGFVLPQFNPLFDNSGQNLPFFAEILLRVGELISNNAVLLTVAFLLLSITIVGAFSRASNRQKIFVFSLNLPVIGHILTEAEVASFSRALGTLLENGTNLNRSLEVLGSASSSLKSSSWAKESQQDIKEGLSLTQALKKNGLPKSVCEFTSIGEQTGELGQMILRAAELHEQKVQRSMQHFLTLLSPIITLVLGGFIALIVITLLVTILEINEFAL